MLKKKEKMNAKKKLNVNGGTKKPGKGTKPKKS